jgi:hypothetical protein
MHSLAQIQTKLAPPSQQQQPRRRRNSTRRGSPATSVREMAVANHAYTLTPPILHDDFTRHEQLLPKLHSLQQPSPGPVLTRPGPEPAVTPLGSRLFFSLSRKPCILVPVLNI